MTDSSGNSASSATYTAFGERIDGANTRYGYAGAWGYQTHDEFHILHVGARYYDPATGRFLQRDPGHIARLIIVIPRRRNQYRSSMTTQA